jgi:hypothetical protein
MVMPDWVAPYGGAAFAALIGSFMRGKSWVKPDGSLDRARIVTETTTAIGLSIAAMAVGYWKHVDYPVLLGLSVFAGWLTPSGVWDLVKARFGGGKS